VTAGPDGPDAPPPPDPVAAASAAGPVAAAAEPAGPLKSAFYTVGRGTGGARDWVTLLHPPYTLWHLSYVVLGAAVVPHLVLWRLGVSVLAFFLAMGIGAHALDELNGRPLGTGISSPVLAAAAAAAITSAVALGIAFGGLHGLPFIVAGVVLVCGYNLELFGGRLHGDWWFGAAWGGFPALVGAFAQHYSLPPAAWAMAAAAFFLSMGQRALSTPARTLRRRVRAVTVRISFTDGSERTLGRGDLLAPIERALRFFVCAAITLALALLLAAR
jgi:hypothetical protein